MVDGADQLWTTAEEWRRTQAKQGTPTTISGMSGTGTYQKGKQRQQGTYSMSVWAREHGGEIDTHLDSGMSKKTTKDAPGLKI